MFDLIIIQTIAKTFVKDNPKRGYRLAAILSVITFVHVFIYAVLVEVLLVYASPPFWELDMDSLAILRYVLLGLAIAELFLIRVLRNHMYKRARKERPTGKKLIQHLVSTSGMSDAICDSVAIYGLLLFLFSGHSLDYYIFMVPSLIFLGIYFPRYSEWEEWIKKIDISTSIREAGMKPG
ncbi:MAG: hypothetical protein V3T23_10170 [Nitrososphaerales archaeon]